MFDSNRLIITNNHLVKSSCHELYSHNVRWVDGQIEDVLTIVRNYCHNSYRLITHPLTGSIKPNQTPYKTVVIEPLKQGSTDADSVIIAENCLNKTLDMLKSKPRPTYTPAILNDFAVIDLGFFQSYLETQN